MPKIAPIKVFAAILNLIPYLTVFISVIAGGILWGVTGMIVFIPIAGIIKIILESREQRTETTPMTWSKSFIDSEVDPAAIIFSLAEIQP